MNVVPTVATTRLAQAMIRQAARESGADAVLALLRDVQPGQLPALVALLARAAATTVPDALPPDRRFTVDVLTDEERRRAHALFTSGDESDWVVAGEREYQRVKKRRQRLAVAS